MLISVVSNGQSPKTNKSDEVPKLKSVYNDYTNYEHIGKSW